MKPKTWIRVREVFLLAVDLDAARRDELLAETCNAEPEVRAEVERLLVEASASADFLETGGAHEDLDAAPLVWTPGMPIGGYRLTRLLDSGGMGTVFEALQEHPRRKVALKTLRFDATSDEARRRFRFEAEVLGSLRHPGIAQVFEAGTHGKGGVAIPFIAMELVENATTILDHAEEARLSERAKLELFRKVCAAVQHGHQKGVIHRDLKPGNILIDPEGTPKVIDFGIARASDVAGGTGERSAPRTRAGELLGTLRYMSPEQLGEDPAAVDSRTDVYSLGVILYELLARRPPYRVEGLAVGAAATTVRESRPERPPGLASELWWILLRSLEKEPDRRYASASELSADIGRYLEHEPVLAAAPSAGYRLSKFARRHRAALAAVIAVILALSVGLIQAQRGARRADREAEKARAVSDFLGGLLTSISPLDRGTDARVADVLADASLRVAEEPPEDPEVLATLQHVIGESYRVLGMFDRASEHLEPAFDLVQTFDLSVPLRAEVESTWALLLVEQQRFGEAERLAAELEATAEDIFGPAHATTLRTRYVRARALLYLGRADEAEAIVRENLARVRARHGREHVSSIRPLRMLGMSLRRQQRLPEALEAYQEGLELCRAVYDDDHYEVQIAHFNLGTLHYFMQDYAAAEAAFRKSLAWWKEHGGADHPNTMNAVLSLAAALASQGRYEEALPLQQEAYELSVAIWGDDSLYAMRNLVSEARTLLHLDRLSEAEAACRKALASCEGKSEARSYVDYLDLLGCISEVLEAQGRHDESLDSLREAYDMSHEVHGADHGHTIRTLESLCRALERRGQVEELQHLARELRARAPDGSEARAYAVGLLSEAGPLRD